MPIDKFGRHMLRSMPYSPLQPPSNKENFYFCQPADFKTPCLMYIRGVYNRAQNALLFHLENGSTIYKSPISGIIKHITITPNVTLFLNGEGVDKIVNTPLNKGDELSFAITSSNQTVLYVELVVLCSVSKDG